MTQFLDSSRSSSESVVAKVCECMWVNVTVNKDVHGSSHLQVDGEMGVGLLNTTSPVQKSEVNF